MFGPQHFVLAVSVCLSLCPSSPLVVQWLCFFFVFVCLLTFRVFPLRIHIFAARECFVHYLLVRVVRYLSVCESHEVIALDRDYCCDRMVESVDDDYWHYEHRVHSVDGDHYEKWAVASWAEYSAWSHFQRLDYYNKHPWWRKEEERRKRKEERGKKEENVVSMKQWAVCIG